MKCWEISCFTFLRGGIVIKGFFKSLLVLSLYIFLHQVLHDILCLVALRFHFTNWVYFILCHFQFFSLIKGFEKSSFYHVIPSISRTDHWGQGSVCLFLLLLLLLLIISNPFLVDTFHLLFGMAGDNACRQCSEFREAAVIPPLSL